MKHILVIALMFSLLACDPFETDDTDYTEYIPVLMRRDVMETSIVMQEPQPLQSPGKIYYKDEYIFINERYEGVHIINNSNPKEPHNFAFIRVPGCIDMAMKGSILYVDNSVDLLAIRVLEDYSGIIVTERIRDVFPELTPPDGLALLSEYAVDNRPKNTLIIGWEKNIK